MHRKQASRQRSYEQLGGSALERVIAPAQPADVGEQPDKLLLVRQVRAPPAAASAAAPYPHYA